MSLDKGSLTAQQTKRTVTTIILIRRIYKSNSEMHWSTLNVQCPTRSWAAIHFPPRQLPHSEPSIKSHGIKYPVCLASSGQPSRQCPLLASCEN